MANEPFSHVSKSTNTKMLNRSLEGHKKANKAAKSDAIKKAKSGEKHGFDKYSTKDYLKSMVKRIKD